MCNSFGKNLLITPICSESYGVRSFCIKVITPDVSILLDPGCALGPYKKFKIPHRLEFDRLHYYTTEIVDNSGDCDFVFISHYHYDHFKPNLEDVMYIYSSKNVFESLYSNTIVLCKQYQNRINYNQKQRGEKLYKDLSSIGVTSIRIGVDPIAVIVNHAVSIYQQNFSPTSQSEIVDSAVIGDTHLIFPREFLHGMRQDRKEIFIQPLIIAFKDEFFYFFPDVQGIPNPNDLRSLVFMKNEFESIHNRYLSGIPGSHASHTIALGGPITYLLRKQSANSILENSIDHTKEIARIFNHMILDHHLIRDPNFLEYWNTFQKETDDNITPFNPKLITDMKKKERDVPVLEINREKLYKINSQ